MHKAFDEGVWNLLKNDSTEVSRELRWDAPLDNFLKLHELDDVLAARSDRNLITIKLYHVAKVLISDAHYHD